MAGRDGGGALEFQDHRDYHPGDDPRHLNWAAYARTGALTMKVFQQEVRPQLDLVVDASASMALNDAKLTRALECMRFALASADDVGAVVRLWAIDGPVVEPVDPSVARDPSWSPVKPPADAVAPAVPDLSRVAWRPNALRVLVSDLLFPGAPDSCARILARGASEAMIFCPFDRSESDPAWAGACEFQDVESAKRVVKRADPPFLKQYLDAYRSHFKMWTETCASHRVALARIDASLEFPQLLSQLAARELVIPSFL